MCLVGNELEAARELHQTMDAVAQLRTDHTATTLSLIATVFLPLTFLAGTPSCPLSPPDGRSLAQGCLE